MKIFPFRLGVLAFVTLAVAHTFAGPALVANKNIAAEKLDAGTLKSVFLGKKVAWDGAGGRVVLAVLKTGPIADEFLQKAADMNSSAFNNHWRRLAMTGGGTAPKFFETEAELLKFVAETPGAIGFAGTPSDAVATLALP